MRFQELEAALLAKQHDEVSICTAPACFWVPIAAEEAIGDVQHPLLGLPPGPACAGFRLLGLTLLSHVQVAFFAQTNSLELSEEH